MAHSSQSLGERSASINDLDLIALIGLLSRRASADAARWAPLDTITAQWKASLAGYGPGTIDLTLDEALSAPEALPRFRSLLHDLDDHLSKAGEVVSGSFLTELCAVPGVRFVDYRVTLLRSALRELAELVGPRDD